MSIGADLIAELCPILDATGDLEDFLEAWGAMYAQAELFAEDTDEYVGWSILWDVDRIPGYGIPWLAQFVGERILQGTPEAAAREQAKKAPNQFRGTVGAIVAAVKLPLTGGKRVWLRERYNGTEEDENSIAVATYESETPDEQAVLNALRRTVPADLNIHYEKLTGTTWAALETPTKSWTTLEASDGPTWADVAVSPGGGFYE